MVSSTRAPANGAGSGSTVSAPNVIASTTGIGGTPRSQPAVADHRQLPPTGAIRRRGHQLGQGHQGAGALAAPQRINGCRGAVAQPRGTFVVAAISQRVHLLHGDAQGGVVGTVEQRGRTSDRFGVLVCGGVRRRWAGADFGWRTTVPTVPAQSRCAGSYSGVPR